MLESLRQFLAPGRESGGEFPDSDPERPLRRATAALFIEVSRADFEVKEEEREAILDAVQKVLGLEAEETAEILRVAEAEVDRSISLYEFTRVVDQGFSFEQKKEIMKRLWLVALSDAAIEKHEEHLLRKIARLIHLHHQDFIDAKLAARRALTPPG
jgi:uncharacterized tellurite resistance protein B-like protein